MQLDEINAPTVVQVASARHAWARAGLRGGRALLRPRALQGDAAAPATSAAGPRLLWRAAGPFRPTPAALFGLRRCAALRPERSGPRVVSASLGGVFLSASAQHRGAEGPRPTKRGRESLWAERAPAGSVARWFTGHPMRSLVRKFATEGVAKQPAVGEIQKQRWTQRIQGCRPPLRKKWRKVCRTPCAWPLGPSPQIVGSPAHPPAPVSPPPPPRAPASKAPRARSGAVDFPPRPGPCSRLFPRPPFGWR